MYYLYFKDYLRDDEREINHHGKTRTVGGGEDDDGDKDQDVIIICSHLLLHNFLTEGYSI